MNKYNPNIHHRRSIRLKGYDYTQAGLYFITICCKRRGKPLRLPSPSRLPNPSQLPFGHIENDEMILNEFGQIAHNEWAKLAERFPNFELDVFQIMPNHMHGIIALVGANDAVTVTQNGGVSGAGASPAPTIGDIVGAYKSLVAMECLKIFKSKNEIMGKLWQRNYYEHIIRNEDAYNRIAAYIENNPAKWAKDKFYSK